MFSIFSSFYIIQTQYIWIKRLFVQPDYGIKVMCKIRVRVILFFQKCNRFKKKEENTTMRSLYDKAAEHQLVILTHTGTKKPLDGAALLVIAVLGLNFKGSSNVSNPHCVFFNVSSCTVFFLFFVYSLVTVTLLPECQEQQLDCFSYPFISPEN